MDNENEKYYERAKFNEITSVKLNDTMSVVISECSKGGFTIAQKMETYDGRFSDVRFMKGAFHLDYDGLCDLRDAIDDVISIFDETNGNNANYDVI